MKDLPHNANLRHLRRQARELQRLTDEPLQQAQHRLAASYGFSTWAQIKKTLDAARIVDEWARRLLGKNAFEALRNADATPSTAQLVPALQHPNPRIRFACLGMLDHLADDESVAAMIAATADPVPRVRRMAVHALGCQRCKASELCVDLNSVFVPIAKRDPVWRVRREALISIVQQPATDYSRTVLAQIAACDAHPQVRHQAAWALRIQRGLGWSWTFDREALRQRTASSE